MDVISKLKLYFRWPGDTKVSQANSTIIMIIQVIQIIFITVLSYYFSLEKYCFVLNRGIIDDGKDTFYITPETGHEVSLNIQSPRPTMN